MLPSNSQSDNAVNGVREVYLQPGDYFWGGADARAKTLLGSCVAICVWHPVRRIGGMSHCLLPSRSVDGTWRATGKTVQPRDYSGRYVDETFEIFFAQMREAGTTPREYQYKIFGGGNMFELQDKNAITVGERNIEMIEQILARENMVATAQHVGGKGHRHVIFEIASGACWVRHEELP